MKLIIFLVFISQSAFANSPVYEKGLKNSNEFFNQNMAMSCKQRGVEDIRVLANADIITLINSVEARIKDPKTPKSYDTNLNQILTRSKCIQRLLPGVSFTCENKGKNCRENKASAWVSWIFGKIHLCDNYFNNTDAYQSAIMIHEVAHKCGAFDLEYHKTTKPRKMYYSIFPSFQNADNFSYWVRKGFCLPEHDC